MPSGVEGYQVRFEGSGRDISRDALQLMLLVVDTAGYLQFVTVRVPQPQLSGYVPDGQVTRRQLDKALALEACPLIRDALERGDIPLPHQGAGFEVHPNIADAVRKARDGTVTGEIASGDVVCEFTVLPNPGR